MYIGYYIEDLFLDRYNDSKYYMMYDDYFYFYFLFYFVGMLIFIMFKFGLFFVCMFELFDFFYFI